MVESPRTCSGRPDRKAVVVAVGLTAVLLGCAVGRAAAPITAPSLPGGTVGSEEQVPRLQRLKVTLIPSVREIRALRSVSYDAPAQGIRLKRGEPYALRVTASGTGELTGEAWLENAGGATIIGRTPLKYDPSADAYTADILMDAARVQAGDYQIRAVLESLEPVTAARPLHVDLESIVPPSLMTEVDAFRARFDTNDYVLQDDDRLAIQNLALKLQPFVSGIRAIRVEGHCDTRGAEAYNLELGSNRAAVVAKVLGEALADLPIGVSSLGAEDPNPPGDTPEDWARNRWARIWIELK